MNQHTPSKARLGDFSLDSAESRAAARAIIQELAAKEGPQPGDVLLQLEESGWPERHRKILEILDTRGRSQAPPKRLAGIPIVWLALPEGFNPESLSACREPATVRYAMRKGELPVLPISLTDLPFLQGNLTNGELARLCGRP